MSATAKVANLERLAKKDKKRLILVIPSTVKSYQVRDAESRSV
jgi:hypothetical protein